MKFTVIIFLSFLALSCEKEAKMYTIKIDVTPTEGGLASPSSSLIQGGQQIQIVATPSPEYIFKEWIINYSAKVTTNPLSLLMDADKNIVAVFEKKKYPLFTKTEGYGVVEEKLIKSGKITEEYYAGSIVQLKATASEGWIFKEWKGDLIGNKNPIEITLDKTKNVTATFEKVLYPVTIQIDGGGKVERKEVKQAIGNGFETYIQLIATPDEGWKFESWSGDIIANTNPILVNPNSPKTIKAKFSPLPFDPDNMDIVNYPLYTKSTSGKKIQLGVGQFDGIGWSTTNVDITSQLDYLTSENFVVWWDKRYDNKEYAIDMLRWSEFSAIKARENGFLNPKDYETHRVNIFIHRDDKYGQDIFPNSWGQGAGHDNYGRAFITYPFYNNFMKINPLYPAMDVIHETTHIFQLSRKSENDINWYLESTSEYFQSIYLAEKRPATLRHIPHMLMSSYLRPWDYYRPDLLQHLYGMQILLHFLDWEGVINSKWIGESFNKMNVNETPMSYLNRSIPNLKNHYFNFALHATVIDFKQWNSKINEEKQNLLRNQTWTLGDATHALSLKDVGTNGYFTPVYKNEAWSYTSIKIENTKPSLYSIDFKSTHNSFKIGLVIKSSTGFSYSERKNADSFEVPANSSVYIVMVNTPEKFSGNDKYDYQIKVQKLN